MGVMRERDDRGGAGLWILIIFIIVGIFSGFRIGRLYFDHDTLRNNVKAVGDDAITTSRGQDVRPELLRLLGLLDVEMEVEDFEVEYSPMKDKVRIAFAYDRSADLILLHPWFSFEVDVQRESPKTAGILRGIQESVGGAGATSARKYQKAIKKAVGK